MRDTLLPFPDQPPERRHDPGELEGRVEVLSDDVKAEVIEPCGCPHQDDGEDGFLPPVFRR